MRRRFYYDADMDAVIERGSNYFEERPQGPNVISDDLGAGVNGLRHMPSGRMLDSKSAHRKENRARGLYELGNDRIDRQPKPTTDYGRETRDAVEQINSNWNGTRDWLRRTERER